MEAAVELSGVSKTFGSLRGAWFSPRGEPVPALRDVSLTIARGDAVGIAGPNGAGKTTLLKLIAALILPTSGRVRVHGDDTLERGAAIRPRIGFVPAQERGWYGRLTLRQNLRFFARVKGIDSRSATSRIEELSRRLDLTAALDRRAQAVSSGFLQRCAVVRALLAEPELLLMDEPTRSLDEATANRLREFVREEHVRRLGRTLVVATHQVRDLGEMCDRVAEIVEGRLAGPPATATEHAARRVAESIRVVARDAASRVGSDAVAGVVRGIRGRAIRAGELEFLFTRRTGDEKLHEFLEGLLAAGLKIVSIESRSSLSPGSDDGAPRP